MRVTLSLFVGVLLILLAPAAFAQNVSADPLYGNISLDEGFLPDPEVRMVTSGGSVEVDVSGCSYGYVAEAPDLDFYYTTSGDTNLYIYVEGEGDTTLLINTAGGSWICNDDGYEGTNPIIVIPDAPEGLYNIWVGSYSEDYHDATLYVSEINPRNISASSSSGRIPDYSLNPTYGNKTLKAGFLPDPYLTDILGGGSIDIDIGNCTYGYVAEAPDFDLRYETAGNTDLYIYARGDEDVTLLINTADGDWICNDDGYQGTDPLLIIRNANAGLYNIWLGTYGSDLTDATLYVSEIDPR